MFELYSANTPNGQKITIALEELGLDYKLNKLNLGLRDQKQPAYLAINPNGRIPALVDQSNDGFAVFESGAILIYLAEKFDKLMPSDSNGRSLVMQWLMFQMSALGPMMGQAGWFLRSAPEQMPLAVERYQQETLRLYGVLDARLKKSTYLAGDSFSIADISTWTWARNAKYAEVDDSGFPNVRRWVEMIGDREGVKRGLARLK
ncbi:MAG: glutathione S-transferase N-terminal domain-containing protein [Motiliproteus sp.]